MKKLSLFIIALFFANAATAQWFWQNPLPQGYHLNSVMFPGTNVGYAVGEIGSVVKTTDAGLHWAALPTAVSQHLQSVFFTDDNTGFAVGDEGAIIKTTNGGTTWDSLASGTTLCLNSVFFTNNNKGFAVGRNCGSTDNGIILRTTDGQP